MGGSLKDGKEGLRPAAVLSSLPHDKGKGGLSSHPFLAIVLSYLKGLECSPAV